MYVKYDDENNLVEYPYNLSKLRRDNPTVSFPVDPSDAILNDFNCAKFTQVQQPAYDHEVERVQQELEPKLIDDVWVLGWDVIKLTEEELAANLEQRKMLVSSQRQNFLTLSDWVVTKAYETGTEVPPEWRNYRQELRDLPNHTDYPYMEFPQAPE